MTVTQLCLVTVLLGSACAPAATGSGAAQTPHRESTVLTLDEIVAAHIEGGNVYDAVARLRPNWLKRTTGSYGAQRETFATVFLEGRQYGEIESLRNMDVNQISEIRYISPSEAGGRYGIESGLSGVIEVTLKKR